MGTQPFGRIQVMVMTDLSEETERDPRQSLRERWSALPEPERPQAMPSAGAAAPAPGPTGATPVAIRPMNAATPDTTRAPRRRRVPSVPATTSSSTVATPVLIGVAASLIVGAILALLQTVVWITPLFEIATGITLGLALIPLRRHPHGTDEILAKTTVGCVLFTFFIYMLVSCIINGTSPVDFIAATTIGRRPTFVPRRGIGFVFGAFIFATSGVGAWYAARKTLDLSYDETLDRR